MTILDDAGIVSQNELYNILGYYALEATDDLGRSHLYVEEGFKDECMEYVVTFAPSGEVYYSWWDYRKEPHSKLSTLDYVADRLRENKDDTEFLVTKIAWLLQQIRNH